MRERSIALLTVALLAVLVTTAASQGQTRAEAQMEAWLSGVYLPEPDETYYDSGSYAQAGLVLDADPALTGFETSVEDVLAAQRATTEASAASGGGSGFASTGYGDVYASALATPATADGYAFAQQYYSFMGSSVTGELAVGYVAGVDLFAESGEYATASATLVVELYDWTLGEYAWPEDSFGFAVTESLAAQGMLPIEYDFVDGNWYSVWIAAEATAKAGIIPAPGALLLGGLGVGLVRGLRRRRSL